MSINAYIESKLGEKTANSTFAKRKQFLSRIANGHTDFSFINDIKRMKKILNEYENINSRWNYLMHLNEAIKSDPSIINDATRKFMNDTISDLKIKRNEKLMNNVKTEKQVERLSIPITDLQSQLNTKFNVLFEKYNIATTNDKISQYTVKRLGDNIFVFARALQDLMYLSAYIDQPALRGNWATMRFSPSKSKIDKDHNWLVLNARITKLYMRDFKNVNKLGKVEIDLYPTFIKRMKLWISVLRTIMKSTPPYVLHYSITKTSIVHVGSEKALTKNIPRIGLRILDKTITIDDYRHLWEMYIQNDASYAKMTAKERENIHKQLLHSTAIGQLYNVQDTKE